MAKQVIWSPRAVDEYFLVLEYLKANWSLDVIDSFIDKVDKLILQIASENVVFKTNNRYHEVLITKHNLMIYRVKRNEIEILSIYDTRSHPKKKIKGRK